MLQELTNVTESAVAALDYLIDQLLEWLKLEFHSSFSLSLMDEKIINFQEI